MSQPDILQFFANFIEKELGIIYADFNRFQLQSRLEEIAKSLGHSTIQSVYEELVKGMTETRKQLLLDISTNNETSFFRDKSVFEAIEKKIIPELTKNNKPINIWCAASSYGQEPYSISILLSEIQSRGGVVSAKITASDISDRVLARAKTGRFTQLEVQRGLPAPLMMNYFKTDGDGWWKLNDTERKRVSFSKQNLKFAFTHFGQFDLILCRNVLIYQSVQGKTEIVNRLTEQLVPGGYLILGSGESLLGLSSYYESRKVNDVIVYQKNSDFIKKPA